MVPVKIVIISNQIMDYLNLFKYFVNYYQNNNPKIKKIIQ